MGGNFSVDAGGNYGIMGIEAISNQPGGRRDCVSWIDSNNYLWLFGGLGLDSESSFGYHNDLWRYVIEGAVIINEFNAVETFLYSSIFIIFIASIVFSLKRKKS
jgi:hypothetical protein